MVRIEYYCFFCVVFFHHFHCKSVNSWLKIGLFSVNHYSNIHVSSRLYKNAIVLIRRIEYTSLLVNYRIFHVILYLYNHYILTENIVFIRFSMLANCSSSLSVKAVIRGSIFPVFKFGTWKASFKRRLVSIRPDQEKRLSNLKRKTIYKTRTTNR